MRKEVRGGKERKKGKRIDGEEEEGEDEEVGEKEKGVEDEKVDDGEEEEKKEKEIKEEDEGNEERVMRIIWKINGDVSDVKRERVRKADNNGAENKNDEGE